MNIRRFFKLGMKREIPMLKDSPEGKIVNLGCGNEEIEEAVNLDLPDYEAGKGIPFNDESIAEIHAYHFFEHLETKEIIRTLREVERVLKPDGVINIVVPHAGSHLAYSDISHESYINEEAWKRLFKGMPYWEHYGEWKLDIQFNMIIGKVERNLALLTQLVKKE